MLWRIYDCLISAHKKLFSVVCDNRNINAPCRPEKRPGASHILQPTYFTPGRLRFGVSTSRLYQIELVHQVEILKLTAQCDGRKTKDFWGFTLGAGESNGVSTPLVRPSHATGEKNNREDCMRNYKRSINLISHIMYVSLIHLFARLLMG
jgi:hypothetical protein